MRMWGVLGSLRVMGMIVALPARGYAQDSVMTGTVTDATGGVLPAVALTPTHIDSSHTFVSVSGGTRQPRVSISDDPGRMPDHVLMDTTLQ